MQKHLQHFKTFTEYVFISIMANNEEKQLQKKETMVMILRLG